MTIPAYAPPSVGPAGLQINTYQSILQDNIQGFLNIYGLNQYVAPDSAIYQLLSIISLKQSDANLGLQLVYNQSSPQTAVGAGLDRIVKMNGLARAAVTFSTATLLVSGVNGTVITNGFAQDVNGNLWALPSPTTIAGSSVSVLGTCTTPGNVAAAIGQINIVATPTTGWSTVSNAAAAVPGKPVEADSQLRARQAISVAIPSLTTLQSTIADVLAVPGVTRVAPGYPTPGGPGTSIENPTGGTDSWGNPPHSISMVAEGGTDAAVAQAIYGARGIGCFTHGTTTVAVVDPVTGYVMDISFFRPTYVPIYAICAIHGYAGTPTTAVLAAVKSAIVAYLNELAIGETVSIAAVNYEAMAVNASLTAPGFGVQTLTIGTAPFPVGTVDVPMPSYYDVAIGLDVNIIVNTV